MLTSRRWDALPIRFCADAGEKGFGGLVGGVLRDELAAAGALEHRAAEGGRAALRPLDRGTERVDRRELLLDPRDDPPLLWSGHLTVVCRSAEVATPPAESANTDGMTLTSASASRGPSGGSRLSSRLLRGSRLAAAGR